jgi:peptide deformylase
MFKIITYPDPFLNRPAAPVKVFDAKLKKTAAELVETMFAADGVGLAAVQVGPDMAMTVINIEPKNNPEALPMPMMLVNPVILSASWEKEEAEEACLSVPGKVGPVWRSKKVIVNAQDLAGKLIHLELDGWFARVLQHEIDHLNGILFIDRIDDKKRVRRYKPGKTKDKKSTKKKA